MYKYMYDIHIHTIYIAALFIIAEKWKSIDEQINKKWTTHKMKYKVQSS